MTIKEVRKRSPTPILTCIICKVSVVLIGARPDWSPAGGGHVCEKDPCRLAVGYPKFVPPDEKR